MRTRQMVQRLLRAGYTVSTVTDTPPYGCRLTARRGSAVVMSYAAPNLHRAAGLPLRRLLTDSPAWLTSFLQAGPWGAHTGEQNAQHRKDGASGNETRP